MTGVAYQIDVKGLQVAIDTIEELVSFDGLALMEAAGALGESQTRRRITDEKTSPDGAPWAPNRAGTPILEETGQHLLQSVAFSASASESQWGAAWEFAHVHQDGAVIVPKSADALVFQIAGQTVRANKVTITARPFVGLSAENREELEELVTDHLAGLFS